MAEGPIHSFLNIYLLLQVELALSVEAGLPLKFRKKVKSNISKDTIYPNKHPRFYKLISEVGDWLMGEDELSENTFVRKAIKAKVSCDQSFMMNSFILKAV